MTGFSELTPILLIVALLGSISPDIDHPGSWIGRRLRVLSLPISSMFGHRGITHSALMVAAILFTGWHFNFSSQYLNAFAIGYVSHLAADFICKSGIPLAYPLKMRFNSIITIKTGSFAENVITLFVSIACGYIIFVNF